MNPKHAKWPKREPIIRRYAGVLPAEEIAKKLGITRKHLSHICSQHNISLRVPGLRSERMKANHPVRREREVDTEVVTDYSLLNALWRPTQLHSESTRGQQ